MTASRTAANLHARLAQALRRLPPAQRRGLQLLRFGGQRYEDIAAGLGLSLDEAKLLLWRARETLRRELAAPVDAAAPSAAAPLGTAADPGATHT
jgi:DNA-directed RNA polymerase specialized sigma24 family protein